ncbi:MULTISPECIES: hypothetical protein [unclassified Janthinobacterium]|uniref:hypothetical protein n=1 Tax=unclassified Janthinobacterium TaxID=2610881 RepID=UPI00117B791E|nr:MULTISPECIES: hypothetical protein [unclassified Janthinobacterium]MED5612932.1 hypothetical protein [Janthinobacterium sp. P210005]
MRLNLLSDINWESKIDHAFKVVDTTSLADVYYGKGLSALVVVLNCRDPELGHRQRIRLTKATNTLYIDVMLDLQFFVQATHVERRKALYEDVTGQVRKVLEKRRLKDFELERFLADMDALLNSQLNGETSTRFDALCLERASGF